jgi:hypothetical protein
MASVGLSWVFRLPNEILITVLSYFIETLNVLPYLDQAITNHLCRPLYLDIIPFISISNCFDFGKINNVKSLLEWISLRKCNIQKLSISSSRTKQQVEDFFDHQSPLPITCLHYAKNEIDINFSDTCFDCLPHLTSFSVFNQLQGSPIIDALSQYLTNNPNKLMYLSELTFHPKELIYQRQITNIARCLGSRLRVFHSSFRSADAIPALVENCPNLERVTILCRKVRFPSYFLKYFTRLKNLSALSFLTLSEHISTEDVVDFLTHSSSSSFHSLILSIKSLNMDTFATIIERFPTLLYLEIKGFKMVIHSSSGIKKNPYLSSIVLQDYEKHSTISDLEGKLDIDTDGIIYLNPTRCTESGLNILVRTLSSSGYKYTFSLHNINHSERMHIELDGYIENLLHFNAFDSLIMFPLLFVYNLHIQLPTSVDIILLVKNCPNINLLRIYERNSSNHCHIEDFVKNLPIIKENCPNISTLHWVLLTKDFEEEKLIRAIESIKVPINQFIISIKVMKHTDRLIDYLVQHSSTIPINTLTITMVIISQNEIMDIRLRLVNRIKLDKLDKCMNVEISRNAMDMLECVFTFIPSKCVDRNIISSSL